MQVLDVRLFQTPRWFQYTMAVGTTVLAAVVRARMAPIMGETSPFVTFSFAVAISAFLGGLGPGLVATAVSLTVGIGLFVLPFGKSPSEDLQTAWAVSANAAVWLFICLVCDLLRKTAIGHKKAMTERDEQRERLSMIFESMSDGFFAVDNEWCVTHANRAFEKFVECEGKNLKGQALMGLLKDYGGVTHAQLNQSKAEHRPAELDIEKPEQNLWYHLRVFPDQFGMSGYVQDTTYRKQLENRNERRLIDEKSARSEAEHASQLKDEFIATLSHELRTPLTAILGWAELLKSRPDLDASMVEGLEAIERSTKLQTQLVEELLDMSRISVGKVRLQLEYLELGEVTAEAVGVFRPAAEAKEIELTLETPDDDVLVHGDASRLLQVISNLVSNAVKFTPERGHVQVRLAKVDSNAVVTVRDDGQGIDPSFQPYLFDRFRQANASITRSHGGLGLGLAIARQLMGLHGGTIEAASDGPGCGSEFTVTIPLIEHRRIPKLQGANGSANDPVNVDGLRVLVVDDERETRTLLNAVLSEAGAVVKTTDSALSALAAFTKFNPDVVLSDIAMPGTDGYALVKSIRELPDERESQVPAIALTAFAREEDRRLAFKAGFQAHLTKPVEQAVLLKTIRYLVAQRKSGLTSQPPTEPIANEADRKLEVSDPLA